MARTAELQQESFPDQMASDRSVEPREDQVAAAPEVVDEILGLDALVEEEADLTLDQILGQVMNGGEAIETSGPPVPSLQGGGSSTYSDDRGVVLDGVGATALPAEDGVPSHAGFVDTPSRPGASFFQAARGVAAEAVTAEDRALDIDLLASLEGAPREFLHLIRVEQPDHGTVTQNGDGTVTYLPDADFSGRDSISFVAKPLAGPPVQHSISVQIEAVADPAELAPADLDLAGDGSGGITVAGGPGRDRINGGTADDRIDGQGGRDVIRGGRGDDSISGDGGNDILYGDGLTAPATMLVQDIVLTVDFPDQDGSESHQVFIDDVPGSASFTAGTDLGGGTWAFAPEDLAGLQLRVPANSPDFTLQVRAAATEGANGDQAVAVESLQVSVLPSDDDNLSGGDGADRLYGGDGKDTLRGDAGNDRLYGGEDEDDLAGGTGNDRLYGQAGDDLLQGGAGNDRLDGGAGADRLIGGSGRDSLIIDADDLFIDGGPDRDTATVTGSAGVSLDLTAASIEVARGNSGDDRFDATGKTDATDQRGRAGDDSLTGGGAADRLYGEAGDDDLDGQGGADRLYGGDGNDDLVGGAGNDRLDGGAGADNLIGGDGRDSLVIDIDDLFIDGGAGRDTVTVRGSDGVTLDLTASSIEVVRGNSGDDRFDASGKIDATDQRGRAGDDSLTGGEAADRLYGEAGDDILDGQGGADRLYGGDGNDDLFGGAGNDRLYGGGGNDDLVGGAGNDRLYGQAGDDTLTGGAGSDQLDGGAGRDHYVWQSGETGTDTVRGYTLAADGDVLNLTDLLDGDPDAPDELDAYLDFGYRRGATEVKVDAQGDGSGVDQVIRLAGVDLTDGGSLSDEEIITQLLANNQIVG